MGLRGMGRCHMDRGHLYERNNVKNIVLCALQIEIINVHVFDHKHGSFYYVLHI